MRALGRLLVALLPAATLAVVAGTPPRPAEAAVSCPTAPHHAELVVEHSGTWSTPNDVISICVGFATTTITGEQLLNLSGISWRSQDFSGNGKAVCQIDGEPQQIPSNCFGSTYWVMDVSRGCGPWQVSQLGVSSQTFGDGDLLGFRFTSSMSQHPPGPAGYCPPVTTPPPATATPGAAPPPTASATATGAARTNPPAGTTSIGVTGQAAADTTDTGAAPSPGTGTDTTPATGAAAAASSDGGRAPSPTSAGAVGGVAGPALHSGRVVGPPASGPSRAGVALAAAGLLGVASLTVTQVLRRRLSP